MLKPAQLHKEELERLFLKTWYDPKYMFYSGWTGNELLTIPDNNYDAHHFASVDSGGNVIGYISYRISWITMSVDNFGIISFGNHVEFAKDVYQAICDLFEKHNMNRVSWSAFIENPAVKGYRNFIKKHGGRECAYHRQVAKLLFSEVISMQTVVRTYPTPTRYNCDPDCYKILDKLLRDGWKVIMCNKIGNDLEYILEKD